MYAVSFSSLPLSLSPPSLPPPPPLPPSLQLSERQLTKKQEEWDKEIPEVPLYRVIKLNAPEWYIIIIGMLGAAVNGCIWPAFALLFGEILDVFALPPSEILGEIHLWAGLFIVLGVVSGTGLFFKVCVCVCVCVEGRVEKRKGGREGEGGREGGGGRGSTRGRGEIAQRNDYRVKGEDRKWKRSSKFSVFNLTFLFFAVFVFFHLWREPHCPAPLPLLQSHAAAGDRLA